jgi:hypothetical protein
MGGYHYTKEDDIIRLWYPKEGLPGAMVKLQLAGFKRTRNSVNQRASILKVKSPYCVANWAPSQPAKHYAWHPRWEKPYEKVQDLLGQGARVADACRTAGLERSMFYRMRKVKEGK